MHSIFLSFFLSRPFRDFFSYVEPWAAAEKALCCCTDATGSCPGAVHRYPGIYLTFEENPGKHQLGEGCATNHRLKLGHLPQDEVGRVAQHAREGEGRKV